VGNVGTTRITSSDRVQTVGLAWAISRYWGVSHLRTAELSSMQLSKEETPLWAMNQGQPYCSLDCVTNCALGMAQNHVLQVTVHAVQGQTQNPNPNLFMGLSGQDRLCPVD